MLDENGKLPRIKGALLADAVATTAGAVLGTSTVTTFVESASGVTEGGRTGLTSFTTAILFGIALLAMPFFYSISEGISMGVISYVVLNLLTGKAKGRISILMYVLAVLFVLKYLFL